MCDVECVMLSVGGAAGGGAAGGGEAGGGAAGGGAAGRNDKNKNPTIECLGEKKRTA